MSNLAEEVQKKAYQDDHARTMSRTASLLAQAQSLVNRSKDRAKNAADKKAFDEQLKKCRAEHEKVMDKLDVTISSLRKLLVSN